jgi:hypothetical protein
MNYEFDHLGTSLPDVRAKNMISYPRESRIPTAMYQLSCELGQIARLPFVGRPQPRSGSEFLCMRCEWRTS